MPDKDLYQNGSKMLLKKKILIAIVWIFTFFFGACFLYNLYALFFPISTVIESDGAEHLHAAYLLSIGERPYIDFIQNHPMLFHHFLVWAEKFFNITSSRSLAMVARIVVFSHFLICLIVFGLWTSRVVNIRPKGILWAAMLITAWAMLDIYNPEFHFMWDIRPDFICYGQSLLGLYLIYLWFEQFDRSDTRRALVWAVAGGCLIGFGNAVLPKGIPFLVAFALSLISIAFLSGPSALKRVDRKTIFGFVLIGSSAALSFFIWMAIDSKISNVPINKWISAVFLLNSRKHIIYSNIETNPVTTLLQMFSIPLLMAFVFIGWIVWELRTVQYNSREKNYCIYIWLFSIYTILINFLLPTYSTGVVWSYYFIPSIFAAAAICLLFLLRFWNFFQLHPFKVTFSISRAVIILMAGIIAIKIINTPMHALSQLSTRPSAAREFAAATPDTYTIDNLLPKEFIYLGSPDQIPIKSRSWGYYFMLAHATNFWKDCHTLGLGPDPQQVWGEGFKNNPPDAIALTNASKLSHFVFMVRACQHIDVSWLFGEIGKNYVLMGYKQASLYVRKDRTAHLEARSWQKLSQKSFSIYPTGSENSRID